MYIKKVVQAGMMIWLFLIVSCVAHSIDYNCLNDQITDNRNKIINIKADNTDGEIYLDIVLLPQYKEKRFSALYLRQESGRGILVPMKTSNSEAGINSWVIGSIHNLTNSELVAHYGEACPLKIVRRIKIVEKTNGEPMGSGADGVSID